MRAKYAAAFLQCVSPSQPPSSTETESSSHHWEAGRQKRRTWNYTNGTWKDLVIVNTQKFTSCVLENNGEMVENALTLNNRELQIQH